MLRHDIYGITTSTRLIAVPPRRFWPVMTIVWLPRAIGSREIPEMPVRTYVGHLFAIDDQSGARFGAADHFDDVALQFRVVHLEQHFLFFACDDQA